MEKTIRKVVMADDDDEDCLIATNAFKASGARAAFSCVDNGVKLMNYLEDHSRSGQLPDLILLDLNMPRKDGREALLEIKSDHTLQNISVVILTTSKEPRDVAFSRQAGANGFITKPETFEEWIEIMKSLPKYLVDSLEPAEDR